MSTMDQLARRMGSGANRDPKIKLIRAASTAASNKFGIGGRPKTVGKPRPITMPKLKCLEVPLDDDHG